VGLALLLRESPRSIAVGIGFSVGIMVLISMLFVSIHELIPFARRYGHFGHFLLGAMLSVLVFWLLASAVAGHANM
jgi:hypothetical protein